MYKKTFGWRKKLFTLFRTFVDVFEGGYGIVRLKQATPYLYPGKNSYSKGYYSLHVIEVIETCFAM